MKRLELKPGVIPHICECQKKVVHLPDRKGAKKRKRMDLVQEALSSSTQVPSTSMTIIDDDEVKSIAKCIQVSLQKPFKSKRTNTVITVNSVVSYPIKMISNIGVGKLLLTIFNLTFLLNQTVILTWGFLHQLQVLKMTVQTMRNAKPMNSKNTCY